MDRKAHLGTAHVLATSGLDVDTLHKLGHPWILVYTSIYELTGTSGHERIVLRSNSNINSNSNSNKVVRTISGRNGWKKGEDDD